MRSARRVALLGTAVLVLAGSAAAPAGRSAAGVHLRSDAGRPVVAFLGDSYTAAADQGGGYVAAVAAGLGWDPVVAAVNGSGYVSGADVPTAGAFQVRLPEVVAADPDVVLVQGSTNDVGRPPADIARAAGRLYADLARSLPGARVIVVGPLPAPGADPTGLRQVERVLQAATAQAGLQFIDPVAERWLQPSDGLFADAIHPNAPGYAVMAAEIIGHLQREG